MSKEKGSEQPERSTRERIQEEISSEVAPVVQAVTENIKLIGLIVGCIVLIAAGISGYKYYHQYRLKTGQERIESILSLESPKKRLQALQDYLPQAPQRFQQGLRLELADLAMKQERYDLAVRIWTQTAERSQKEEIRTVARLGRAKALLRAGDSGEALALLQDLSENAPQAFRKSVYFELAAAAESEGKWEQALAAYKQLKSQSELGGQRGSYFQYKIARIRNKIDSQATRTEQTEKDPSS